MNPNDNRFYRQAVLTTDHDRPPGQLRALSEALNEKATELRELNDRLHALAAKLYGSQPTAVPGETKPTPPIGLIGEAHCASERISQEIGQLRITINRLEELA